MWIHLLFISENFTCRYLHFYIKESKDKIFDEIKKGIDQIMIIADKKSG